MTSSLVGSEMCIRDRLKTSDTIVNCLPVLPNGSAVRPVVALSPVSKPVSYTHLTLPTICSV
eukprot:11208724-Prorocentrum_lima.AAC.1